MVTVGIIALQGAVREHARAVEALGAVVRLVRHPAELAGLDALILPGGESTAMARLARPVGLFPAVRAAVEAGLPVLATCAGLILLADDVADPGALTGFPTVGGLSVTVRRNAFGGQLHSGVADLRLADGAPARGVFIRAPRIEAVGPGVEVLARLGEEPVAVRQGGLIGCTLHPELSGDLSYHRLLLAGTRP